jgi:hypothetical protein
VGLPQNKPKDEPKQQSLPVELCQKMSQNVAEKTRIQMHKAFD